MGCELVSKNTLFFCLLLLPHFFFTELVAAPDITGELDHPEETIEEVYDDRIQVVPGNKTEDDKPKDQKPTVYLKPDPAQSLDPKPAEPKPIESSKPSKNNEAPKPSKNNEAPKPSKNTDLKPSEYTDSKPEEAKPNNKPTGSTDSSKPTNSSEEIGFVGSILKLFGRQ